MVSDFRNVSWRRIFVLVMVLAAGWLLIRPMLRRRRRGGAFCCRPRATWNRPMASGLNWWWLGREIIISSLAVTRAVLDPRMPISPCVIEIRASSEHPFDQVILGNSITLTPGTLSLDVYKGVIKVHALTEASAKDLASGEMDRRVTGLRGV